MTWPGSRIDNVARFGVNYVPGKNWWYSWVDWDPKAIDADLRAVSALGMDHIRIHCLWPVFQPNATYVSDVALQRLESLLDIADQYGLDVIVTVFNGWLSGFDFRPDWISEGTSVFKHEEVLQAQEFLLEAIAVRVGSHVRFLGFDLANEPSVIAAQERNQTTSGDADRWLSSLLATCERLAPGRLHSVGMDHLPWITDRSSFSRATTANTGAVTAIHAWTYFTGALERYGPSGVGASGRSNRRCPYRASGVSPGGVPTTSTGASQGSRSSNTTSDSSQSRITSSHSVPKCGISSSQRVRRRGCRCDDQPLSYSREIRSPTSRSQIASSK